jgi:Tol biopolymer transport system component
MRFFGKRPLFLDPFLRFLRAPARCAWTLALASALAAAGPGVAQETHKSDDHRGHQHGSAEPGEPQGVHFPGEDRLANVQQLTFGGQNAEAYWSPDAKQLIFQATLEEGGCDQIFTMGADGADPRLVSTGEGRTTCAYFLPGTKRILYSSTHHASPDCPPPPDHSRGYVWPLYSTYEICTADADGSDLTRLTNNDFYDAEATVSVDGSWIVFTSTRDGDLDLYKMRSDGSDLTRLTDEPGYDGGAFFSPDGSKIVFRASRPEGEQLEDYRGLLEDGLIRPGRLEIYWMNADGTNKTRVTDNGAANFAPYFTPDGERILFASNVNAPRGRNFDLFLVNLDGTDVEQVTHCPSFDSFPMFSPDGTKLAFASNRNGSVRGETNIFVADWVEK